MIIRQLLHQKLRAIKLPAFSQNKIKNKSNFGNNAHLTKFKPQDIKRKLDILENNTDQFANKYDLISTSTKNSPLNYVALFARSCLIARSKIQLQDAFITIKKSILKKENQLSPQSCTALMESLVYYKFEGDQSKIIHKLCDYYRNFHNLFTQNQQLVFWESYLKIMTEKAHSTVQFYNLQRKDKKTIQLSNLSEIFKKSIDFQNVNKNIVKQITYEDANTALITMNKPKITKNILVKIKGIPNVNELQHGADKGVLDNVKKIILDQISDLNSNLKKGWNVIIYGETLQNQSKKQQYKYKFVDLSTPQNGGEGYWKSQKMQQSVQLNESNLNDQQFLSDLKQSNQYIQGVYFNSSNIDIAKIDMIGTLMLGVNPRNLKQSGIKFISRKRITEPGQFKQIFDYISLRQLRQCYGYAKICELQWKLHDSYTSIQNIVDQYVKNEMQNQFGLSFYKEAANEMGLSNQQLKKALLSDSQLMSQMAVNAANNVNSLRLERIYNQDYKNIYRYPGNYAGDIHWQMKPLLGDTIRIVNSIESLVKNLEQSNTKQIKVMIIAAQDIMPHLVSNLLQAKYWTVPKYRTTNETEKQAKNALFDQLFNVSSLKNQ